MDISDLQTLSVCIRVVFYTSRLNCKPSQLARETTSSNPSPQDERPSDTETGTPPHSHGRGSLKVHKRWVEEN